jgi:hypothetical protein
LLFFLSLVIVVLTGAVILWSVAQGSGAVGKVEKFMDGLGFTNFKFRGGEIFKFCVFGGLVGVIAGTVFATVMAFLYNLISDLVGGIEVQVIEEEQVTAGIAPPARKSRLRGRGPARPARGGKKQPQPPPPQQVQRRTVV